MRTLGQPEVNQTGAEFLLSLPRGRLDIHNFPHDIQICLITCWALSIMRTCSLLVMMMAATVFAGDTNGFRAYERLNLFAWTPAVRTNVAGQAVKCIGPVLDPGKAAMVTNGISLGDLVTNLGPGWVSPASRAKSIHWDFADGRFLNVSPPKNSAGEDWQASFILSTTNTPSQCHVWWVTNMTYCFTNPAHEK